MPPVKTKLTAESMRNALIVSNEEVRLKTAFTLIDWYLEERSRADQCQLLAETYQHTLGGASFAYGWMVATLLAAIACILSENKLLTHQP
jgi:hypothetical protein